MELRDIEYFAVVAEHGHLGRAAEALGLSQPALSKSLARLEESLQAPVVRRSPKGVELTAEGRALLARIRDLRLSLQSVSREIADVSAGRAGQLRVGVGLARPEPFLSSAFATLLSEAPKTNVVVTASDNDLMIPALRNGELDLFVNYLPHRLPREGLICTHLYDDEHVACVSKDHKLTKLKKVTIADLKEALWAVSALTLSSQDVLKERYFDAGVGAPTIAFECRSASLKLRTVAASDLLDWTSRSFVEHSGILDSVHILNVPELAWRRPVGVVHRDEKYLPPIARRFISILKSLTDRRSD